MRTTAFAAIALIALILSGPLGAVAAEPDLTPPTVVGQGRNAGIFVTKPGQSFPRVMTAGATPQPQAAGTVTYVDIPTIAVIYTDYYHTADCQMHLTAEDVAVVISEIEKTRKFNWRSSHMKCNMDIDYLIIGDDPGERTLTPDMMWSWVENGYWLPFWSCDGGATSVEQDLYDNGIVDGQYAVVLVTYAFKNCDTAWSPIGGGTYGVDMGCIGDAAYIGDPMAWGLEVEGVTTHEYLHALDSIFEESGNPGGANPHHADQPATFPYPKDCGLHFNFLINNVLDPAGWLGLYPQWRVIHTVADTDEDGVPDGGALPMTEATMGTGISDSDSDDDGLSDLEEAMAAYYSESDPLDPDSDGDGIKDGDDPYPLYYCNEHVGEGTPTIDGTIDPGEYTEITRYNEGDLDHAVIFYGRWEDGVLYYAAAVTDELLSVYYTEPWWNDNIEIHIDAQGDGWFVAGNQNYRFLIVPKGGGGVAEVYGHNYYDDPGNDAWHEIDVSAVTAAYSTHTGGYVIEVAIPDSVMAGVTAGRDAALRTTFFVEDFDEWPGWPRYNLMTELDDDRPGFVYLTLNERLYYVNAATGDDGYDGEAQAWDGSHGPMQSVQACIDAALDPAIVNIAGGTYVENLAMATDVWLHGAGADKTTIASGVSGARVVDLDNDHNVEVSGLCLLPMADGVALRSLDSTVTVRDCIISGGTNGVGVNHTGAISLINCLIANNAGYGMWAGGSASVDLASCTFADNANTGAYLHGSSPVTVTDSILCDNGDDIDVGGSTPETVSHCLIGDGDYAGSGGNITGDPLFVAGLLHDYYLSQTAAGQASTSPCVNAGSDTAAALGLDALTTRTDGVGDAGDVDMGYHAVHPLWITDIVWDQTSTSVEITFASMSGVSYTLEAADADAYSDALSWADWGVVTGATGETTLTDSLSTYPLSTAFRFYRVKRTDQTQVTSQTAAVFEMPINAAATAVYFISTPLVPDPDHNSVAAVFGEGAARQIVRSNFTVSDLDETNGSISRMRNASGTYSVLAGSAFAIEPGVGYELYVGLGFLTDFTLRLTGYVPEGSITVPLTKENNQAVRWMGYSLPRTIKLSELGLVEAVTPLWAPTNKVRLLPPASPGWFNYTYDTGTSTWSPSDPDLLPGMGIVFIRAGCNNLTDALVLPTWYLYPPNTW